MQNRTLGDTLYFWFAVNSTAGEATDATGTPTFDVRKGGAASSATPTLEGSATLLSHANYPAGAYEIAVAATGGNGFEADAEYGVFCQAAVSSVNPIGYVGGFRLAPVPANAIQIGGTTQTGHDVGGTVATNLNATVSSRATQASLDTLAGYVDTEVAAILAAVDTEIAAIKAKTDQMTFTVTNVIDSSVTHWKGSVAPDMTGDAFARLGVPATTTIAADIAAVAALISALNNLSQANIRTAVGLASANLDTQLGTISGYLDTEIAAILAAVDTEIAAIKTKTDMLTFTVANVLDVNTLRVAGSALAATGLSAAGEYYNTNVMLPADLVAVQNDDSNAIAGIHAMGDKYNADGYLADSAGVTTLLTRVINIVASQASVDALAGYTDTEIAAILAAVDTEVAAIKAKTDQITFTNALTVDASLQAAADVATAVANKLADIMARRTTANIEASAFGDTIGLGSLYSVIQQLQKSGPASGATFPIYKADGSTLLGNLTLSFDAAAEPVTGVE